MENSSEELVNNKKPRAKLNLTLPENYKELDPIEQRRAYQRAYCKSKYVSRKISGSQKNPDAKVGRPPKLEKSTTVRPSKRQDYVKEYNKKYYAGNKEKLDPINIANQKKIRERKKAEKLNAIQAEVHNIESESPKPEAEAANQESSDDYVVNNVYMLLQLIKK